MSVIQKIRSRYAKLAGFVIALSLVGFILMDASNGPLGSLFGRDSAVAKVNGDKIDVKDYSQKVKDYEVIYGYTSKGRAMDDATRAQINQQALNDLVNNKLIMEECEKLGITTTPDEEKEMIYGANADPIIQQYQIQGQPIFMNQQSGMFDPQMVKGFEQQLPQIDPTGKLAEEWETIKNYVKQSNALRKYNALFTKNVTLPSFVYNRDQKDKSEMANARFIKVPYATIDDKSVPVKDEELIDYMKKHESIYKITQPIRNLEYVAFDVLPTAEDTARALGALNQLKTEFTNTTDAESIVNRNSDEQYNPAFVNKKSFMSAYADTILKLPVGTVYGPYFENGSYKMVKVIDKKVLPDSVKSRHILVRTEAQGQAITADSIAKKKIDSAIAMAATDFTGAVTKYSEDEGSKQTGGEYTFTLQQKQGLSKEFGDFIFDGKAGEKKLVKVENDNYAGYHYIEILEQSGIETAAKLAIISKTLAPGDNTENAVYAKASEFAGKNGTEKAFDEAIKKQNLNKRIADNIKENDFSIQGIGNSREIIRWAYESKVGDVSPVFTVSTAAGTRYVVAKLAGEQESGLMKLDANTRPSIEMMVRNEKKAKMIQDKYKSATSLEQIAQMAKQPIVQSDSFNASSPFINTIGYEPKLVGYIFYKEFKTNTLSPGFKGQESVIYTNVLHRFTMPSKETPEIANQMRMMMGMQMRNAVAGSFAETLKRKAKISYNVANL